MAAYPGSDPNVPPPPVVTVVTMPPMGHESAQITCPHCYKIVMTDVKHEANNRTHLNAILLCLLCGCIPGCIPYCCNSCQTAVHSCPSCGQNVGVCEN